MNLSVDNIYQYIGQQINGSLQQKCIFVCWLSLPIYLLIIVGSSASLVASNWIGAIYNPSLWLGVFWGGLASTFWVWLAIFFSSRTISAEAESRLSQTIIALFGCSGIISLLLIGPFNLVTGVVLAGCVQIGLLLFPTRQVTLIFALSIIAILSYSLIISFNELLYRPILTTRGEPVAQLWYSLLGLLAAAIILIKDAFTVAALTNTWRRREAITLHRAKTDPLTGVANRGHAVKFLELAVEQSGQSGKPLSVVLVDVDHFKQINDQYGHQMGDLALKLTADSLQKTLRDNDLVGRYGGEEFLLILPGSDEKNACRVAERCAQALREISFPKMSHHLEIQLTASFGICCKLAGEETTADQLVKLADNAMYEAKRQGRDRVVLGSTLNPPLAVPG